MRLDPAVGESATLAWTAKIQELKAKGRSIVSLGLGEPDYPTPPHIVEAAHAAMKEGLTRYSAAAGLPELRAAIAGKLERENGIPAKPGEVVVTPGAKNALFLACAALLEPGDEAVTLTPGWVSNVPILKLAEPSCMVREVALKGPDYAFDRKLVGSAVSGRTKLLLINYPNNPTGRMLTKDEAAFLVELLRSNPELRVVSDEIYESLALGAEKPFSPASIADVRDRVVTVNGLGKAHSMTGWRVGWLHAAPAVVARALKIHAQLNSHVAPFIQKAGLAAMTGPQEHRAAFLARLKANREAYLAMLKKHPAVKGSTPDGGFFAFLDVSAAKLGSDAFAAALLDETGVAVLPGISFGAAFDRHCRISLATPAADFQAALDKIAAFVEKRAR